MKIRNFRLNVVVRIILILVLGYGAYYFFSYTPFWLMSFWMILFSLVAIISLINYVERSYRDLSNFLMAIKENDFTSTYPIANSKRNDLNYVFNLITREFQRVQAEKESNFLFFKTVVEHSGVPLLAYSKKERRVRLTNPALQDLLEIHRVTKLNTLEKHYPDLMSTIYKLDDGEKILYRLDVQGETLQLSVSSRKVLMKNQEIMIVALHNINSELDQKEIESWQRLIRVLTHEIKNSAIPISTLTEVIQQLITRKDGSVRPLEELDEEDVDDLQVSIHTIGKRSRGLVKFVEAYGDLARVPKPTFQRVDVVEVLRDVINLQRESASNQNIDVKAQLPSEKIYVNIDPDLMDQVLINLLKNAIEALAEDPGGEIGVQVYRNSGEVTVCVTDNGPGMDKETLESIFIPFFTTKNQGSGIGLSLSRQIVRAHGGRIRAYSTPGDGTRFEIILPD